MNVFFFFYVRHGKINVGVSPFMALLVGFGVL